MIKRILLITQYFYPDNSGSSPTFISELLKSFSEQNNEKYNIDVLTTNRLYREKRILQKYEKWGSINIRRFNSPRPQDKSIILRFIFNIHFNVLSLCHILFNIFIKLAKYDLVIITSNPPFSCWVSYFLKKTLNINYIYFIWDLYPDILIALDKIKLFSSISNILFTIQHEWLKNAKIVVTLGNTMTNYISKKYNLQKNKITEINNWSNIEHLVSNNKNSLLMNEDSNIEKRQFIVMYGGNLGLAQDIECIIEAAKEISKIDKDVIFKIYGNGSKRNSILNRIRIERIENIELYDMLPKNEYYQALKNADICLILLERSMEELAVPSKFYGLLNAGKVIVSLCGLKSEISLINRKYKCGVALNFHDVENLVSSILELKNNKNLRKEYSINAQKVYDSNFTSKIAKEKFKAIISDAMLKGE